MPPRVQRGRHEQRSSAGTLIAQPRAVQAPQLFIRPRAVRLALTCAVVSLLGLSLAGQFARYELGGDRMSPFVVLFDVNLEGNIPAWYSASTILSCSVLFAVIGIVRRRQEGDDRFATHWLGLSLLFLLASIDESASLHELVSTIVGGALSRLVKLPPYLYYAWVLVAIPFLLVLAVIYLRFLAALPRRLAGWLIASAVVYVSGAFGFEMAGGYLAATIGMENMRYALVATVEEGLEMAGIAMLLYALLQCLAGWVGTVTLAVTGKAGGALAAAGREPGAQSGPPSHSTSAEPLPDSEGAAR